MQVPSGATDTLSPVWLTPPPGVTVVVPELALTQPAEAPGVYTVTAFAAVPRPNVMAPARTVMVIALRTVISNSGALTPTYRRTATVPVRRARRTTRTRPDGTFVTEPGKEDFRARSGVCRASERVHTMAGRFTAIVALL